MTKKKRNVPVGIAILAIINMLLGLMLIAAGITVVAVAAPLAGEDLDALISIVGWVIVVIGAGSCIVAWGLWKGKKWAWYLSAILRGLGIIADMLTLNAFGLIIDAIVLFYLLKTSVQKYFGVKMPWSW